jgi:hypothetical protein
MTRFLFCPYTFQFVLSANKIILDIPNLNCLGKIS